MATRSLNQTMLIGNLTRDPELRYTPNGMAVCTFGLATNRVWTTQQGEKKEDVQFHRVVAWNRLAELCAQLLAKGRRVYVGGRLQYREWVGQDNVKRQTAEVVIDDMIILDSKGPVGQVGQTDTNEIPNVAEGGGVTEQGDDYSFMQDVGEELAEFEPVAGGAEDTKPVTKEPKKTPKSEKPKKEEAPEEEMPF